MLTLATAFTLGIALLSVLPATASADTATTAQPPTEHYATPLLPATVDLRPLFEKWGLSQRRQGNRGTCSVFAVTGALEFAVATKQQQGTRLSVEFLNWAGHHAANRTEDGGFFSELWKGYQTYGICPDDDLPYQHKFDVALQPADAALEHAMGLRHLGLDLHWIKEWNPHTGLTDAQLTEIKTTLAKQEPVCGGFRWPTKPAWQDHVLRMCPPEDVFDGHSVLLVGYRDDPAQPGGGVFLIRNSGGDGPDGAMPYAYVHEYMNDSAWIGSKAGPKTAP